MIMFSRDVGAPPLAFKAEGSGENRRQSIATRASGAAFGAFFGPTRFTMVPLYSWAVVEVKWVFFVLGIHGWSRNSKNAASLGIGNAAPKIARTIAPSSDGLDQPCLVYQSEFIGVK